MNFSFEYEKRVNIINEYIDSYISNVENIDPIMKDGMRYAVLNGGKRLRSILCTEICSSFTNGKVDALPYAASIEFIHAYSLVHDDLPAMDNAELRRNLPSCHKKFGEDVAILIGDALLNTAFEIMLENASRFAYSVDAAKAITSSSGIHGMINGQMRDIGLLKKSDANEIDLMKLIEEKTVALIEGSAVSGAILAECGDEDLRNVKNYAYNLGVAFQIRDDFEDFAEDEANEHNSPNFINILGFDAAKSRLTYHKEKSFEYLTKIPNSEFLRGLHEYLFPSAE